MKAAGDELRRELWPLESELPKILPPIDHPVPCCVRRESREDDRPHSLRDNETEQNFQSGNQQEQHQELSELDPEIEGEQRGHQMRARELKSLSEGERESEAVN